MRIVVDTDVVAAALLDEDGTSGPARATLAAGLEIHAPDHWKAELANVVWQGVRQGRIPLGEVDEILTLAENAPIESRDTEELWRGAVSRSIASGHSAYDTLFVELACRLGTKVVSNDEPLRRRFPDLVVDPTQFLVELASGKSPGDP